MSDIAVLVKPARTLAETAALVAGFVGGEAKPRANGTGFSVSKDDIGFLIDEHGFEEDVVSPPFSAYPFIVDVTAAPDREADLRVGRLVVAGLRTAGIDSILVEDQYEILEP